MYKPSKALKCGIGHCKGYRIREGGDIGLFIPLVPQHFLIRWFNNFRTELNFDLCVHLVECPKVSTTNCNLQKG